MGGKLGDGLALILLNYRRPQNIGRIASDVISVLPGAHVFILDQSGRGDLTSRNDVPWDKVWYRKAAFNGRAGARIRLASTLPFDYFLAVDDDVFLSAGQIVGLAEAVKREPDRAHGLWGRTIVKRAERHWDLTAGTSIDGPVSAVHMIYAFSRDHANRTMALAAEMGFPTWEDLKFGDDILVSNAGTKPALCHNLGPISLCPTWRTPGVAVQAEQTFDESRATLYKWLLSRGRMFCRAGDAAV